MRSRTAWESYYQISKDYKCMYSKPPAPFALIFRMEITWILKHEFDGLRGLCIQRCGVTWESSDTCELTKVSQDCWARKDVCLFDSHFIKKKSESLVQLSVIAKGKNGSKNYVNLSLSYFLLLSGPFLIYIYIYNILHCVCSGPLYCLYELLCLLLGLKRFQETKISCNNRDFPHTHVIPKLKFKNATLKALKKSLTEREGCSFSPKRTQL